MVGFIICLVLGAIIGAVGGVFSWLEQHGKAPWQKGTHKTHTSYDSDDDDSWGGHTYETKSAPQKKKHNGRCDGDCANCPPHYGYRHGRWYYGHDHIEGCEFGGNKGSGGRD